MGAVSVSEIILAVDEPIDATQCGGKENCYDDQKCLTHDLWAALNERIFDYLGGVSLRQLVEKQKAKEAAKGVGVVQVQDMRGTAGKRTTTVLA
jgi:Rrf2 family iron-sulfur cluster assembly transcriptional regulator